jgi:hypothetical protein
MSPFFPFNSGHKLALQPFGHPFGIVVDQVDYGPGERIRLCPALLPVLQGRVLDVKKR